MLNKYLTIFDNHTDYEQFAANEDVVRPNVSFCRDREKEVHYLYDAGVAKLYNGTELLGSIQLGFGENQEDTSIGYHDTFGNLTYISFITTSNFDKIQIICRKNISNLKVVGVFNADTAQFTYSISNDIITIESTEGKWNGSFVSNFNFDLSYKVNNKNYQSTISINDYK